MIGNLSKVYGYLINLGMQSLDSDLSEWTAIVRMVSFTADGDLLSLCYTSIHLSSAKSRMTGYYPFFQAAFKAWLGVMPPLRSLAADFMIRDILPDLDEALLAIFGLADFDFGISI
jgi:hypothetical protein